MPNTRESGRATAVLMESGTAVSPRSSTREKEWVTGTPGILVLDLPLMSPVTLGGLVLHLGNEGLGLLSSQAPSGSNMM